jgi:hypothetical protein
MIDVDQKNRCNESYYVVSIYCPSGELEILDVTIHTVWGVGGGGWPYR